MEDKRLYDAYGNEIEVSKNDFKLVQVDKKIHDKKFETKATTYGKDALKRFAKNKSSVVGFFIIALLLLLALVYPVVSPYNVDSIHPKEALLSPKLFEPKEGSWSTTWNGAKILSGVKYDEEAQAPIKEINPANGQKVYYNTNAIVTIELISNKINIIQNSNVNASGGTYIMAAHKKSGVSNLYLYEPINYNVSDGFHLTFEVGDLDLSTDKEFEFFANKLGEYRVFIQYGELQQSGKWHNYKDDSQILELIPWTTETKVYDINISNVISSKGLTELKNGRITIELKCESDYITYLPIEQLEVTVDNETAMEPVLVKAPTGYYVETQMLTKDVLSQLSLTDANAKKSIALPNDGSVPLTYWKGNANKYVAGAGDVLCNFVFDYYEDKYGMKETDLVDIKLLREYRDNGWCSFDDSSAESIKTTFKVLDEKCPVSEIVSSNSITDPLGNTSIHIVSKTVMYKYYGYSSMPKYILGSDDKGKDLITNTFKGLRTSLLLSICVSAVCLSFGLCWGAISGYFGGNVDLFMERFCDILGGVPWIVVMTLAILLLGNNILTFAMALCLTGWMGTAARTRTQFYRFKGREYILASRTLGSSDKRLIFRHILPNSLGTIVTGSVLSIPSVMFSEATLSYLNLGLQGVDSFGIILSNNQQYINSQPALIIFPAIIISLIMISFNLFGNGLRDALNPSLKGSE